MSIFHGNTDKDAVLAQAVQALVKEQRSKRRWGIFFKLIGLSIFTLIIISLFFGADTDKLARTEPHVALIDMTGEISAGGPVDANSVVKALTMAFKDKGTQAVILRINSPGGSPVQSDYIYNAIMRLRQANPTVPVYAVCVDVCASGAYFIASAAQNIYANPASIVGSIGVIMSGFGFDQAIQKIGVSRRVIIAGANKDFMDPFMPLTPESKAFAQKMLDNVHQQFIAAVEKGRGDRLKKSPDIFSGLAWTGEQAKTMGLIDGFGSAGSVARDVVHQEKFVDYTIQPSLFERFADRIGASMGHVIMSQFNTHISE
jgi:protease-4